jgi:hypothetical protein
MPEDSKQNIMLMLIKPTKLKFFLSNDYVFLKLLLIHAVNVKALSMPLWVLKRE